jgi:hypothetical protein
MFKTISLTAVSVSLLLGSLAASPVSTAFAKSYFVKQRSLPTEHRMGYLVFSNQGRTGGKLYTKVWRLGNRGISIK